MLRREADLDQAVRWVRWAESHVGTAMDRFAAFRTPTWSGAGEVNGRRGVRAPGDERRVDAARLALSGVRDVLTVLEQALGDLGVSLEPMAVPQLPSDLEPWFRGIAGDAAQQVRVVSALEVCEAASAQVAALLKRVHADHAATRQVLDGRRARWRALLRGE